MYLFKRNQKYIGNNYVVRYKSFQSNLYYVSASINYDKEIYMRRESLIYTLYIMYIL